MIPHLPELDRMSRALSRLETALLTHRASAMAERFGDSELTEENHQLRLQCQEMRELLYEAHLILGDLLRLSGNQADELLKQEDAPIAGSDS